MTYKNIPVSEDLKLRIQMLKLKWRCRSEEEVLKRIIEMADIDEKGDVVNG